MKNWYESKTLWLNMITTVIMVLELTQVIDIMGTEQIKVAAAIVAILNVVLRVWYTDMGIKKE